LIRRHPQLLAILACGALSLGEECARAGVDPREQGDARVRAKRQPGQSKPSVEWETLAGDKTRAAVTVAGADVGDLDALRMSAIEHGRWTSFLWVRVVSEKRQGSTDNPPVLGGYKLDGDIIRFEPRFPLEPGVRYRAEFDPAGLHALVQTGSFDPEAGRKGSGSSRKLVAEYSRPKQPARSTTEVVEVYPTPATLPENLLRFYLYFSAPMSRGEAYRRIKLVDAKDKPVPSPFLELDEELWSGDGKRFTLFLDPGRIKRGLKPRAEVGPVLEAGKSYCLVIDRAWPDAEGNTLKSEFRRSFRAGAPDDSSPDPKAWKVEPPRADTFDPLLVRFPEPMDRALLDRLIAVRTATGTAVAGRISVADGEMTWRFAPMQVWRAGDYTLVIGTDLEDVGGNSVARPFEVDLAGPISRRVENGNISLSFRVGGGLP
jgi:hypothetical protein